MNDYKVRSIAGVAGTMILVPAFEIGPQTKATLARGKGYMAALRKLQPGEEVFLAGARQAHQLAHRIFGKGNYRTRRTLEGMYVAYTPHINLDRCPTCGAVRGMQIVGRQRNLC